MTTGVNHSWVTHGLPFSSCTSLSSNGWLTGLEHQRLSPGTGFKRHCWLVLDAPSWGLAGRETQRPSSIMAKHEKVKENDPQVYEPSTQTKTNQTNRSQPWSCAFESSTIGYCCCLSLLSCSFPDGPSHSVFPKEMHIWWLVASKLASGDDVSDAYDDLIFHKETSPALTTPKFWKVL